MSTAKFAAISPSLPVSDLGRSITFYTGILGFAIDRRPTDLSAIITRDGLRVTLQAGDSAGHGHCHFQVSSGISGLYSDCISRGVRVHREIQDEPNGTREFTILDPDKNQLSFGQPIPS